MPPQPLTNFEMQKKYYQNEPKYNGNYSKNNLHEIKDGAYVQSIGTHWISLHVNDNNVTYFGSFGVEHIPKEIKKSVRKQKYYNKYL